jgi:prepilin-type N-terminal cleavage/methylation domain-containing protein
MIQRDWLKHNFKTTEGFSLVELLVVIAIIAILAALLLADPHPRQTQSIVDRLYQQPRAKQSWRADVFR